MRVTLLGAAGGVTGSAYLIQTGSARLLLDFGIFQGADERRYQNALPPELDPRHLDAVLLTHAHLDHVGRLPLVIKGGFRGPIFCTPATIDLADLVLRDSAKIQTQDAEDANQDRRRRGEPPIEPLYDADDVAATIKRCQAVAYNRPTAVAPGVQAHFVEAGHMLGSTSITLTVSEEGRQKTVVFSGDVGPRDAPLLRDPIPLQEGDLVFLESTYGDRDHRAFDATVAEFRDVLKSVIARRGIAIAPAFAIGRAQTLLYLLAQLFRRGELPVFPVYLDSPMAVEAMRIYQDHPELVDPEARDFLKDGPGPDDLDYFSLIVSAHESRTLNEVRGPALIVAPSGMATGGRVQHHLKHHIWQNDSAVLITGYQAEGSLGRQLVEGADSVRILGDRIPVRASVHTLNGFSAHAGQSDLVRWFAPLADDRPHLVLTHGEQPPREALAAVIRAKYGIDAALPGYGAQFVM